MLTSKKNSVLFGCSKRSSILFCLLGLSLFVLGCGGASFSKDVSRLRFADDISLDFSTQLHGTDISLVQQVVFEKDGNEFAFTAMVELTKGKLTIAGLSPLGQRLFLMEQDSKQFSYEAQMLFELPFPPQYLARDFWLVYGQLEVLQAALAAGSKEVELQATKTKRRVSIDSLVIEIEYTSGDPFATDVVLQHHLAGYTLKVTTAEVVQDGNH